LSPYEMRMYLFNMLRVLLSLNRKMDDLTAEGPLKKLWGAASPDLLSPQEVQGNAKQPSYPYWFLLVVLPILIEAFIV
jgi:hypothetical protein